MNMQPGRIRVRGRWGLILLALLVGAGALTGFAFASTSRTSTPSVSASPSTLWTWGSGVVPGAPMTATRGIQTPSGTAAVQTAAAQAGVAVASLRAPAVASDGLMLLFGQRADGTLCSADVSSFAVSGFTCLSDWTDQFAMVLYSTDHRGSLGVDDASLVGVARPDVTRVSVTTASGPVDLALNEWRGFTYTASFANDLPISITAYNAAGAALDTEEVEGASGSG